MGRRGPAPKPTELKKLAGNPGRRPLNRNEAHIPRKLPRCPSHLSDEGKREWRRIVGYLYDAGLLTAVDAQALAMYCETVALWIEATRQVNASGLVGKTKNGNIIQNPYLSIANGAKREALRFMQEFGLTPASRARIVVGDKGMQREESLADALFRAVNAD